jgi:hypothetical protein
MPPPGRNDPCHCGSGRKYKKCCLDSDRAPALRSERDEGGLLVGRAPIDTIWEAQGKRVRAVGSGVAFRPPHETDHEFYVDLLCSQTLGAEWHRAQLKRPAAERHVIEKWTDAYARARSGESEKAPLTRHAEHSYSSPATGELKSLLCLAYDNYTLLHAQALPDSLVKRLRRRDQFQGARYEMAVAAVFVRAGYEIRWLTETDRKLPEFIASHPASKVEIAVEAKSRHRPGVLDRDGDLPDVDDLRVDVDRLMKRALEKETDGRPYIVCLDLNLPPEQGENVEAWSAELHRKVLAPFGREATGEPDRFSAVFFTNYSWHWDGEKPAGNPMSFVIRGLDAAVPLLANEAELLAEAILQYGNVPGGGAAARAAA